MSTRALAALLPAALLGLAACDSSDPLGCAKTSECPAGHICASRRCEKLCASDLGCPSGYICNVAESTCARGQRDNAPVLDAVDGSGSTACVATTGNRCIGTAIEVHGSFLAGAEFKLVDASNQDTALSLLDPLQVDDGLAVLVPAADATLGAGSYQLIAVNAAGQAQTAVQLLQGEQGPPGPAMTGDELIDKINAEGTLLISSDRIAGGGTGSTAERHVYEDSATTFTAEAVTGNRMVVKRTATTTVQSLAVNDGDIMALCADADGCTLTLAVAGWKPDPTNQPAVVIPQPLAGAPCRFFIDPTTRDWSVSTSCSQWYATWEPDPGSGDWPTWLSPGPTANEPGFYTPYYTSTFGKDAAAPANVVLHNRACYLAEAAADATSVGADLQADSTPAFYLIASAPGWAGSYFPAEWGADQNPNRYCLLVVDD